ncbi:MAG: hypothetical protein L0332_09795 [Chloroflexi bacterium]|nr:hypothetical protein [Chloroflexota bacterium]MCI0649101.1 hypothetical protein [Chloroflexota bacterium]MCI0726997.1 hypothetical protein [Chloroflexota bacterium]
MQLAIPLHRGRAISAGLTDGNPIEHPPVTFSVGFQGYNHQPLVWICCSNFWPTHFILHLLRLLITAYSIPRLPAGVSWGGVAGRVGR